MLSPYADRDLRQMQVLEPEAGGAAILDFLIDIKKVPKKNLYAIEQDPELVYTLQGKEYKVIHNDFLTYSGDYLFDLILMNPPFSNGDEHLLKAWDVLKSGDIVCLLNEETIKNPYTAKRKLLKSIIDQQGTIEYLGDVFRLAERKTNVGTALVRLHKKAVDAQFSFDFDTTTETPIELTEEVVSNEVAMNDLTGAMLRQYDKTRQAFADYIKAKRALQFYSKGLLSQYVNINQLSEQSFKDGTTDREAYNAFLTGFKGEAWNNILAKLNISKYLTNGVMNDFEKFKRSQGAMDLTRENIYNLIQMIVLNRETIMEAAVIDVFDLFTKYHPENRIHVEGWKTNSAWKVNKKVILPGYLGDIRWCDYYSTEHTRYREFSDIEKIMCYITGKDFDDFNRYVKDYTYLTDERNRAYKMMSLEKIIRRVRIGDTSEHESEFFYLRCFKKGTLHIRFKDEWLWAEFNQRACKGKNWLPN